MSPDFFLLLTYLTGFVIIIAILIAYKSSRDTFHPLIYLGLMMFFFYCYLPLQLFFSDSKALMGYLSLERLEFVQRINLLGVVSLCIGVLFGSNKNKFSRVNTIQVISPLSQDRIRAAAICAGIIGVIGYVYGIVNVGGFQEAYGRGYGGGWSESGWIREAVFLTIPAILWLMITRINKTISKYDWLVILLFASPFLLQGLLGARRGPTSVVLLALIIGWYLIRARRPPLPVVIAGAILIGSLLLFLVTNRGNIYLGSDFDFTTKSPLEFSQSIDSGNEFIYGGGTIVSANEQNQYFWGRRYFIIFFIRPIPKEIWSTKYLDMSKILEIPNIETNLGLGVDQYEKTLGWAGAVGAAPGIIADMWVEFSWFYTVALYFIGWLYGRGWHLAITKGGLWVPNYTLMTALSVYLISQTLEAMAFRYLITATASWLIWCYGIAHLANNKYQDLES